MDPGSRVGFPWRLVSPLILVTLCFSVPSLTALSVKAGSNSIFVPDDYPTIQSAIKAANSGDVIIIRARNTFKESIVIDKSLILRGEDRNSTIIDGMGNPDGIVVAVEGVTISGFTIHNCSEDGVDFSIHNVTITDCTIRDCGSDGLEVSSDSVEIVNCLIEDCGGNGLYLRYADGARIERCVIWRCSGHGVRMWLSNNSTVQASKISDNDQDGVYMTNSDNTFINDSDIHHNRRGVYAGLSLNPTIRGSRIFSNIGTEAIWLENSDEAKIYNCEVYENQVNNGIELDYCDGSSVSCCLIHDNTGGGIEVDSVEGCSVSNSTFFKNGWSGIFISKSYSVLVDGCNFYNHTSYPGITLEFSDSCQIENCESYNNDVGIYLDSSDIISISNSKFYNNTNDVRTRIRSRNQSVSTQESSISLVMVFMTLGLLSYLVLTIIIVIYWRRGSQQ